MALKLSTAARTAAIDGGTRAWLNSTNGRLAIYTGAQPSTGGTAMTGTLLSTHSVSSVGAASSGVITFTLAASTVTAAASGTAASFVLYLTGDTAVTSTDETMKRITGTVGTSGADLNFDSVTFVSGGNVTISSFTLNQPAS